MTQQDLQQLLAVVQLVVSVLLLLMTGLYVWLTQRTAKAAEESTNVSKLVLEEMRQQRLEAGQPILYGSIGTYNLVGAVPQAVDVVFINAGNGPALDLSVAFHLGNVEYPLRGGRAWPSLLMQGAQYKLSLTFEIPVASLPRGNKFHGQIAASYEDMYRVKRCHRMSVEFDAENIAQPWMLHTSTLEML